MGIRVICFEDLKFVRIVIFFDFNRGGHFLYFF